LTGTVAEDTGEAAVVAPEGVKSTGAGMFVVEETIGTAEAPDVTIPEGVDTEDVTVEEVLTGAVTPVGITVAVAPDDTEGSGNDLSDSKYISIKDTSSAFPLVPIEVRLSGVLYLSRRF